MTELWTAMSEALFSPGVYDCRKVEDPGLRCTHERCVLTVEAVPTRFALRFQHGENPEHCNEFDVVALELARLGGRPSPVQTWMHSVHAYENGRGA